LSDELDWAPSYTKKVYNSYKKRVADARDAARAKYNGAPAEEAFSKATQEILDKGLIPTLSQYIPGLGWSITGPTSAIDLEHFYRTGGGSLRFAQVLLLNRYEKYGIYGFKLPYDRQKAIETAQEQKRLLQEGAPL